MDSLFPERSRRVTINSHKNKQKLSFDWAQEVTFAYFLRGLKCCAYLLNLVLDSITTVGQVIRNGGHQEVNDPSDWGKAIRKDGKGKTSIYERDLGKDEKVFTFIFWAD